MDFRFPTSIADKLNNVLPAMREACLNADQVKAKKEEAENKDLSEFCVLKLANNFLKVSFLHLTFLYL
jgi:hypothetical protein